MDDEPVQHVRVAICADREAFDRFGGVLRHLLVGLVDSAVSIRVLSADPRVEALTLGPIQVVRHAPFRRPILHRRVRAVLPSLTPQPPTTIHALSGASYRLAAKLAEAAEADLVVQVTSLADCEELTRLPGEAIGRAVAVSQPLVEVLRDQARIDRNRIELIRPGVATTQQILCFAGRERPPTIVCSSPLERGSGVELLIEALAELRRRQVEAMLFLVGSGRREPLVRRLTRDHHLSAHVIIACPAGEISQAFRGADIFVQPSVEKSFTADALHAMGAGIVTVTLGSPVLDYYRNGENAVVCERVSASSLADALEHVIADEDRARQLAVRGVEFVRLHHSMSTMAERYAETYRKLIVSRSTYPLAER